MDIVVWALGKLRDKKEKELTPLSKVELLPLQSTKSTIGTFEHFRSELDHFERTLIIQVEA